MWAILDKTKLNTEKFETRDVNEKGIMSFCGEFKLFPYISFATNSCLTVINNVVLEKVAEILFTLVYIYHNFRWKIVINIDVNERREISLYINDIEVCFRAYSM